MNPIHLHLLVTHLPIFGSILGAIVLAHGLWTKSNPTKIAAYNLFILSAIGAGVAYLTGESAEETVENIQGVMEARIEAHAEFALFALISLIVLGLTAIAGLYLTLKKSPHTRKAAVVIFFVALFSFGLVARTGYLGGQIRHTEIANGAVPASDGSAEGEGEEDD